MGSEVLPQEGQPAPRLASIPGVTRGTTAILEDLPSPTVTTGQQLGKKFGGSATHLCGCRQEVLMDPTVAYQRREQRFRALFDAVYVDLLRFVQRRVHPTHAEDVVSDVMLVAWRRLDDVPADPSAARAWLFGVAHKTLQNARRREGRQDAVAVRLAETAPASANASQSPEATADRVDIAAAWPRLSPVHQEVIALAVLDGLTAPEAALVLGISPAAFRLRLSRARNSLRRHIEPAPSDGHLPGDFASARSPR